MKYPRNTMPMTLRGWPFEFHRTNPLRAARGLLLVAAALAMAGRAPQAICASGGEVAPESRAEKTPLAPGTLFYLRLETAVSTKTSHLHNAVTARVVREVAGPHGVAIPVAAVVRGKIDKLIPSSSPTDRARLRLRFTTLQLPGGSEIQVAGRVVEVENARENVLPDGTIQGVLPNELPLTHLENAIGKLGKDAGDLKKTQEKALGKGDVAIEYAAGTDFVFILAKPLELENAFPPAVPEHLDEAVKGVVEHLLADAPRRAASKDGKPGDPVNLVFIGSEAEVRRAFEGAGWSAAEKSSAKSIWESARAVMADRGYGAAPVSELYLFGRAEDFAFEKMLNTLAKRHHLRLWRSPAKTSDGREIWLSAATHDIGIDIRPGVISHAIDPELDLERAKVGADLVASGRVARAEFLMPSNPLSSGLTATGGTWKTDGRVLAMELKSQQ